MIRIDVWKMVILIQTLLTSSIALINHWLHDSAPSINKPAMQKTEHIKKVPF